MLNRETILDSRRMQPKLKKFIQSWLINTLAVLVAVYLLPGIEFVDDRFWTPFVVALVLGILNAFVRPILVVLALPLLIFTLGLFLLIINAVLLWAVSAMLPAFHVRGFWWAFLGALIISIVSTALNLITGTGNTRVEVRRGRGPDRRGPGDGGGPVIDV